MSCEHEDRDPFDKLDFTESSDDSNLEDLICQLNMPAEAMCSVGEYMNGEYDIPTCSEYDDNSWEDDSFFFVFFASLDPDQPVLEREGSDDASFDFELPPPKVKNFGEAIQSLEDVQTFLDRKGYSDQATTIAAAIDLVVSLHCRNLVSARKSTLNEYF